MTRGLFRFLLFGAMLLVAPTVGLAYVVCTTVVNVYPDGYETHCLDCILYNAAGQEVGEITNCNQDELPGKGPV
jgi:hypothetical protein